MGRYLQRYGPAANWWASEVVWYDPCASIIPGSERQWQQMRQALKGRKRYISDDAKLYSPNLPASSTALKQRQWGGVKVNWFMVLSRGVVHVEVMPPDWNLDGQGLAAFVDRLPKVLEKMLRGAERLPRHVFTDRGTGMYNPQGKVARQYADAVSRNGFKLYWGSDAARQSPDRVMVPQCNETNQARGASLAGGASPMGPKSQEGYCVCEQGVRRRWSLSSVPIEAPGFGRW